MQRAEVDWIKADSTDAILTGQSLSMSLCVPLCIALSLSLLSARRRRRHCYVPLSTKPLVLSQFPLLPENTVCSFYTVIFSERTTPCWGQYRHTYTYVPYPEADVLYNYQPMLMLACSSPSTYCFVFWPF